MEPLVLVVAVSENGVIGKGGTLPWRLPEDLQHFRRMTEGHVVIMGRRTWDEVGKPLPKRRNIVVSRTLEQAPPGAELARSLDEALVLARRTDTEPRVIGGSELFREALPRATRVHYTEVKSVVDGDTFFPPWDRAGFVETERRKGDGVEFVTWERREG
jgi:dihydrofolate reductase